MSHLARALLAELDNAALDELAALLAPRLAAVQTGRPAAGYMTPKAAAAYAGLSVKRIYDLTSSGAIEPDGKDGRTPLYLRETIDAYVRRGVQRGFPSDDPCPAIPHGRVLRGARVG